MQLKRDLGARAYHLAANGQHTLHNNAVKTEHRRPCIPAAPPEVLPRILRILMLRCKKEGTSHFVGGPGPAAHHTRLARGGGAPAADLRFFERPGFWLFPPAAILRGRAKKELPLLFLRIAVAIFQM